MPSWLLVCGMSPGTVQIFNATYYFHSCGEVSIRTTEAQAQHIARDSYTIKNLYVYITANDLDDTTTVRTRVNGGNGNQSVSIADTTTGAFQDTVNTDNLVDGNLFNYQVVTTASGSGTITYTLFSLCLETASNTTPIISATDSCGGGQGQTTYSPIGGAGDDPTEVNSKYTFRVGATLSNLRAVIITNGIDNASTIRTRVNGGNGNQSVSIPGDTTGTYEDEVAMDVIASGNDVNLQSVMGDGGFPGLSASHVQFKSNSAGRQTIASNPGPPSQASGLTRYTAIEDALKAYATADADVQVITEIAFTAKNLFVRLIANDLDNDTTIALRVNGGTSALAVSIASTATGAFEDADTVPIIVDDLLNYMVDTGGASGSVTATIIGFEQEQPDGVTTYDRFATTDTGIAPSASRSLKLARESSVEVGIEATADRQCVYHRYGWRP